MMKPSAVAKLFVWLVGSVVATALPVFNLTAVGQTSSAPTAKLPSLDVIQSEYAAGHLQSALRLAKAIDAGRLEPALARQYRRLQFDLNFESGRYQEALAAGAFCRQQLESDTSVDVAEMASFVIRLARVYRRLEQPDQAARLLKWTLTRLPPLVDANVAAKHPAHDTQAHAGLARIEVMAELAREQEHSVTPVRPPKSRRVTAPDSTWTQVVASAQRWLSGTWPATISVEARCRAVEVLTVGLLQTGRRRELADSLRKLADEPLPDDDPRMKARWLGHLARQYERLGDDRAAAELFERALALAQSVAPTDPTLVDQSQRELADLAFGAARANVRLKQTDRAGEFVKSATEKYRALETTAAGVRERLHAVARLEELAELLGDLPEAIRTGCHLIKLQEAELDQFDPRPSCARTSIASLCMASGDVREAFELAQRGWAFFENRQRDDAQAWGAALFVLSQAEQALGQFEASLARLKKNRASWNHRLSDDDLLRIKLEAQFADLLVAQGLFLEALPILERLIEPLQVPGDQVAPDQVEPSRLLAHVLLLQALAFDAQGQFPESLARCRAAYRERARTTPAEAAEMFPHHLALCRMCLHQLDEPSQENAQQDHDDLLIGARDHSRLACTIVEMTGRLASPDAARALHQRGLVRHHDRDESGAFEDWQQALAIARTTKLDVLRARLLVQVGRRLAEQKRFEQAEPLLAEAVAILEDLEILPGLRYAALCNRAQVLLGMARAARLDKPDAARVDPHEDQALNHLRRAVELIELPRAASTGGELARARYFARYAVAFDLLVDLFSARFERTQQADDFERALFYADRSRNRTLLDELWAAGDDLAHALGPQAAELLTQRDRLLDQHAQLEARILAIQDQGPTAAGPPKQDAAADPEMYKPLRDRLREIRREYAKLHAQIQDLVRHRAGGAAAYPVYNLAEWQSKIMRMLQPYEAILLYHSSATGCHLFLLAHNTRNHWRLRSAAAASSQNSTAPRGQITSAALTTLVDGYRQILSDARMADALCQPPTIQPSMANGPALRRDLQAYGALVGQVILPPACRQMLTGLNLAQLIVVPDGPLQRLPIEALIWESGAPPTFADERLPPLAYTPSLMIFGHVRERCAATAKLPGTPALVTLGVSDYSAWQRSPLSHASQESQNVASAFARRYPAGRFQSLCDAQATERNLRDALARAPCTHLHLAAHADVDRDTAGLFGRILLTRSPGGVAPENDGALYAHEVSSLPLESCELVVLSACNTNIGPDVPLECGGSLVRAFLATGARRVMASHWEVDDATTEELITNFIDAVLTAKEPSVNNYGEALHVARARLRRQHPAPYYWAPFVLFGPGRLHP